MTETPDLPCPKCGSQRTEMIYCNARRLSNEWAQRTRELAKRFSVPRPPSFFASVPGCSYVDASGKERACFGPEDEHFHRGCLRCEYRWITEDVVTT